MLRNSKRTGHALFVNVSQFFHNVHMYHNVSIKLIKVIKIKRMKMCRGTFILSHAEESKPPQILLSAPTMADLL